MADLANEFAQASKLYGKIIITEKHLPLDLKTIKPITKSIGGIAGGEKTIVNGACNIEQCCGFFCLFCVCFLVLVFFSSSLNLIFHIWTNDL